MKSFLLATGESNPLTSIGLGVPSPMVPVVNRPVMLYAVELLKRNGYLDIYVNLYHQGEQVESYFGDGKRWGVDFTYLLQREALGTAGSVLRAHYHIDAPFLVMPANAIIDFDIEAAFALHKESSSIATVIVQGYPGFPVKASGRIAINNESKVIGAHDSQIDGLRDFYNTGVYIFDPAAVDYIPKEKRYDLTAELLPLLLQNNEPVVAHINDGYWNPLDSYGAYQHAQKMLLNRLRQSPEERSIVPIPYTYNYGQPAADGVWYEKNSRIHPDVRLNPPVYIGSGCHLLANSEVGPNVVVGSYAVVAEGATIKESTVFDHTYIGSTEVIQNKIVCGIEMVDIETGGHIRALDTLALADVNPARLSAMIGSIIERGIASVLLILLLPILLIVGGILWVALGSFPIIQVEKVGAKPPAGRVKEANRPKKLWLWHLRTQTDNKQPTRVGAWVESLEFHRLPELWNIAIGELSFVGVEPLSPALTALMTEEWHRQRSNCKAGFTGFWYTQTPGGSLIERCAVDAYYAATRGLRADLWQVLCTPAAWLKRIT